ncbi:MAG: hypothetical protein IK123_01405, partial [Lachnospiraceae bacterium]|nr:hypothetical protein [Lachnospiraceae bacterium]
MKMSKVVRALGAITMAAAVIAATVLAPVGDGAKVHAATTNYNYSFSGIDSNYNEACSVATTDTIQIKLENTTDDVLSFVAAESSLGATGLAGFPCPDVAAHDDETFALTGATGSGTVVIKYARGGDTVIINIAVTCTTPAGGADPAAPGAGGGAGAPAIGPHSHDDEDNLEWTTLVEADESNGGYAELRCKKCGEVIDVKWVNAYYIYNINTVKKIEKAPVGGTVLAETDRWVSFHKMVFDALAARPDVTLNVNYVYDHQKYTMTIPAGKSGLPGVLDENGYAGYRRICTIYP